MAHTRLMITMHKGDPHVLDFDDVAGAQAALLDLQQAMNSASADDPRMIAGRLVLRPSEARSAELTAPPSFGLA